MKIGLPGNGPPMERYTSKLSGLWAKLFVVHNIMTLFVVHSVIHNTKLKLFRSQFNIINHIVNDKGHNLAL